VKKHDIPLSNQKKISSFYEYFTPQSENRALNFSKYGKEEEGEEVEVKCDLRENERSDSSFDVNVRNDDNSFVSVCLSGSGGEKDVECEEIGKKDEKEREREGKECSDVRDEQGKSERNDEREKKPKSEEEDKGKGENKETDEEKVGKKWNENEEKSEKCVNENKTFISTEETKSVTVEEEKSNSHPRECECCRSFGSFCCSYSLVCELRAKWHQWYSYQVMIVYVFCFQLKKLYLKKKKKCKMKNEKCNFF
jgi:hypothetical protein